MIRIGPSGNDELFYEQGYKNTEQVFSWLKNMGLNAYEYSFGRGIIMTDAKAILIGQNAQQNDVAISVHAPYFINFANTDELMVQKSFDYVTKSLNIIKLMGGNRVVVHTASCGKLDRTEALLLVERRLSDLAIIVEQQYSDCLVCLETMGKYSQIGTYEEIIDLCTISPNFLPTLDFGHINCILQGGLKTKNDFIKIFQYCIDRLGYERTKKVHIHFSKIEYGPKGESKHLTLADESYGPEVEPLLEAIKELNLEPRIICESRGIMAQDAKKIKEKYENLF